MRMGVNDVAHVCKPHFDLVLGTQSKRVIFVVGTDQHRKAQAFLINCVKHTGRCITLIHDLCSVLHHPSSDTEPEKR